MAQGCGGITMEVVDKRTEKNDDWHVGDVVCYYNNFSEKPNYKGIHCRSKSSRSRRIMPDWIYAALFLAILALVILLVGGL